MKTEKGDHLSMSEIQPNVIGTFQDLCLVTDSFDALIIYFFRIDF